ncbi:MAG TPA: Tar ligand binding domain-containing protein [Gallionella sp.]|nr:Tar ligand binding domain-containing protein [Gallionella sp.]
MKIGMKLFFLLGLLSLLLIAVGVLGLRGMKTTDNSLESVYDNQLVPAVLMAKVEILRRESVEELLLALQHDPRIPASKLHEADHPVTRHTDAVATNRAKIDKLWEQYMATTLTPEEKKLAESVSVSRKKLREEGQAPMMALLKEQKFDEAGLHGVNKLMPIFKEAEHDFEALMQLQADVAKNEKDKADDNYTLTRNLALISIAGGFLLALGIGYWIIRSITARLTESMSAISSSATQIAATITQHERTASQQAAAANETSATLTELSASSRQSAEQAANAAAVAEKASAATAQGGDTTHQAVMAMANLKDKIAAMADQILHLSEQTGQIGSVATLLKDLSGQINMLSINAAVEAVRAGEHGKGFAVVASEIRKLADQSKKSAEQTSALVADIQKVTNS